jgi:hypothetical protein
VARAGVQQLHIPARRNTRSDRIDRLHVSVIGERMFVLRAPRDSARAEERKGQQLPRALGLSAFARDADRFVPPHRAGRRVALEVDPAPPPPPPPPPPPRQRASSRACRRACGANSSPPPTPTTSPHRSRAQSRA